MTIEELGFNDWFRTRCDPETLKSYRIARIVSVFRDQYTIIGEIGKAPAEITGKLMFNADSALDYPAVGDWVYVEYFDNDTMAIIHRIFPRKTLLKRKTPGKTVDFQLIAANIDSALIMQSMDSNYNLARLERYLVMVNEAGIEPIILLSKRDLITDDEQEMIISEIQQRTGVGSILSFSNISKIGIEEINRILSPKTTYCLLGSSGVGKSSLMNRLCGEEILKTREVREADGRGRHTTSTRQMFFLANGAMIIDTPGMRELGNFDIDTGISETFNEIDTLARQCKFSDCTHVHEKGCAVLQALKENTISCERYQNYLKMKKEAAYYEMSYLEKRKRDKSFAKVVKNVMKNKPYKA